MIHRVKENHPVWRIANRSDRLSRDLHLGPRVLWRVAVHRLQLAMGVGKGRRHIHFARAPRELHRSAQLTDNPSLAMLDARTKTAQN
jgi:hypothetical protein